MHGLNQYYWEGWDDAAGYFLANKINLDEALKDEDLSIQAEERYDNLMNKSKILDAMGKKQDAEVLRAKAPECTLEAQDFRNDDSELIYTCYCPPYADVLGVQLATGKVTTYRKLAGEYNEVEGTSPDGQWTLVESSRERRAGEGSQTFVRRVRPMLLELATDRLVHRHGVDPELEPDRAREITGDRLWQLITGDDKRTASLDEIEYAIHTIENL